MVRNNSPSFSVKQAVPFCIVRFATGNGLDQSDQVLRRHLAVTVHHDGNVDIPAKSFAIPLGDRSTRTTICFTMNECSPGIWTFSFDIVLDERGCAVSAPIVNDQHTIDKVSDAL